MRDVKPYGRTGEIAEVSPAGFEYLTSLGMAVPAEEIGERIETPEKAMVIETAVRIPEKAGKAAARPAAKKAQAKKEKGK